MGFIKEPEGVDFVIDGKPLTEEQREAISKFIRAEKLRLARKEKLRARPAAAKRDSESKAS